MSNYEKQNFVSGQILKAEHLNNIEDGFDAEIDRLSEEIENLAPRVEFSGTSVIPSESFAFYGNNTVAAEGTINDNASYYAYVYRIPHDGEVYLKNWYNSTYGFFALFNGYPSSNNFVERKYHGNNPSEMGRVSVTAGQYVYISVNLITEIKFFVYFDYAVTERPSLFRQKMRIVWFGDSISQLMLLPHRVGDLMACTVYDCSFAGAPMTHGNPSLYDGTAVLSLSEQIVSGDFTTLDAMLDAQAAAGTDVTAKRVNAATLKGLDFNTDVSDIVIMAGTNDLNNDWAATNNLDDFKQNVQTIINRFNGSYPRIRLYFISNPYRGDLTPAAPDKNGRSLPDIIAAIREVCEANNVPFLDLYHTSGINANTIGFYLMSDMLHLTEAGDVLLAEKCAKWLSAN